LRKGEDEKCQKKTKQQKVFLDKRERSTTQGGNKKVSKVQELRSS